METPKRSVFHRIGRRSSVFDRIQFSCGDASRKVSVFDRIQFSCGESNRNRKVSVFERIGIPADHQVDVEERVCKFWVQGRCARNHCRFLHSNPPNFDVDEDELKPAAIFKKREYDGGPKRKRPCTYDDLYDDVAEPELKRLNIGKQEPGCDQKQQTELTEIAKPTAEVAKPPAEEVKPEVAKVAKLACEVAPTEEDLHCNGSGLSLSCKLKRHNAAVTGVCLPPGVPTSCIL